MATVQENKNGVQLPSFTNSVTSDQSLGSVATNSVMGKTSLDLEQNPFEQSFAPNNKNPSTLSNVITSPILTPGGRKLPPLVLSPNVPSSWSTTGFPRTGLTPNESSLRTGLTPGGSNFPSSLTGLTIHGINTPGSLAFPNFTPGLSSILGNKEFDQQLQSAQRSINEPIAPVPEKENKSVDIKIDSTNSISQKQKNEVTIQSDGVSAPSLNADTVRSKLQKPKSDSKRTRKKSTGKKEIVEQPNPKKIKLTEQVDTNISKSDDDEKIEESNADGEPLTEEEKRKQFLERNRVAASKCRQRKKQQLVKMENDLNYYLNEYNNLTGSIDQLKEQSMILRAQFINNKVSNPEMVATLENILQILNQTNYISRMRGNNPSNIIPTVQPINPALVHQNQQLAALNAAVAAASSNIPPIANGSVVNNIGATAAANILLSDPSNGLIKNESLL